LLLHVLLHMLLPLLLPLLLPVLLLLLLLLLRGLLAACGVTHRMTWTCALMTRLSPSVKPSSTLPSSMNFFQPQSCSFLQKRCSVSAAAHEQVHGAGPQQA
jgi:hypothetical protein